MADENTIGQQLKIISSKLNDTYDEKNELIQKTNSNIEIDTTYSSKTTKDQTKTLGELLDKNKYNPNKPFRTDIVSAVKQNANLAIEEQKKEPGKVNTFLATQQGLALLDKGINVINPLILTGAIPTGGLLTTKIGFPQIGNDTIVKNIDTGSVDKLKRIAAANQQLILGQEEGIQFSSIKTIGDLINKGANALVGLFASEKKKSNIILKATEATFEQRLAQNDITPDSSNSDSDVYKAVYGRKYIGSISQKVISEGFSPIGNESESAQLLSEDINAVVNNETAFLNNAISDKTFNNLQHDGESYEADNDVRIFSKEEPNSQNTSISFPFYFESLNTLLDTSEKYITFQATFHGLKEKYLPQWSETQYFGRNTNTQTYSNTKHDLGFDFIIWAKNRFDLAIVKQRVNWLVKHCYPKYTSLPENEKIKIISEGPVLAITIGDLFKNVSGIITSLDLDWDLEGNNRWEMSESGIMTQSVKVSLSFDVIFNRFMENADVQNNEFGPIEATDFYPAINRKNKIRKRKFILGNLTPEGNIFDNTNQQPNFG